MIETNLSIFSIELDKRKLVSYTIMAFALGWFLRGLMIPRMAVYAALLSG